MGIVSGRLGRQSLPLRLRQWTPTQARWIGAWSKKYRLTLLFAITAIALTAAAAMLINIVVGNLAENNLIRIAEENTARDGLHIQSMMRMGHSMGGGSSTNGVGGGDAMQDMGQSMTGGMPSGTAIDGAIKMQEMPAAMSRGMNPSEAGDSGNMMQDMQMSGQLTLDSLAGPGGLPMSYPSLVDGLNILQFDLLDANGTIVWSTNSQTIGLIKLQTAEHQKAAAGEIFVQAVRGF